MKKTNNQDQGVTGEELAHYQHQCHAIGADWAKLRETIDACSKPDANKEQLEWDLIALKSRLSCDYPVLARWRNGGYGLSAGVNKMLTDATNLATLVGAGTTPESRVNRTWRDVEAALQKISEILRQAQAQLGKDKPAFLPEELFEQTTHHPFPVKKALKGLGIVVAVILAVSTLYIMRNFLGFWAPGAGEGLVVDETMSDEAKIQSVLAVMNEAFKRDDVDMLMTVIANDFKDDEGNSRTKLRVGLQAYHEKGDFKSVQIDGSRMELLEKNGFLYARPIVIRTVDDEFSIHLGFKSYRGKLLIATGSGT